ncbi:MAG: chorismate mutase [Acetobacteraceae bacterium]|nr:chorismate mutase [Acetobacteraceae bacterium]
MTDPDVPLPDLSDLAAVRAALDEVDDALHALVKRRAAIVAALAASRAKSGPPLRAGREAAILRRLLANHSGPLPPAFLVRIWREILASSLAQQGGFALACFGAAAEAAARLHFGPLTPLWPHATAARALAAVVDGEAEAAVLPAAGSETETEPAWWTALDPPRLFVVARLPILAAPAAPQADVVTTVPPDPSGADRSLIRAEVPAGLSRAAIAAGFASAGLPAAALHVRREAGRAFALAEVAGFLRPEEPRLARLPYPRAVLVGAFAEPIEPPRP